jgi:glycosyltransferase involved in cell wall biosynthesis
VVEVEGAPRSKIHTIHYGLEIPVKVIDRRIARPLLRQELGLAPDAVLIGTVGRLIAQKGVVYALRGFARIAAQYPQAHLIVAGEGGLRAALEAETQALGVDEHVHFLGWRDDVPHLMAGIDVFLMPSLWEGFGLVLLEAMAQSVPVIGSAVSAIPEIVVDGETGRLVPPRDPAAIASALEALLEDEALRRHMGMMGLDRLETRFNADRMASATLVLYAQLKR